MAKELTVPMLCQAFTVYSSHNNPVPGKLRKAFKTKQKKKQTQTKTNIKISVPHSESHKKPKVLFYSFSDSWTEKHLTFLIKGSPWDAYWKNSKQHFHHTPDISDSVYSESEHNSWSFMDASKTHWAEHTTNPTKLLLKPVERLWLCPRVSAFI